MQRDYDGYDNMTLTHELKLNILLTMSCLAMTLSQCRLVSYQCHAYCHKVSVSNNEAK